MKSKENMKDSLMVDCHQYIPRVGELKLEEELLPLHSNPNVVEAVKMFESGELCHTVKTCILCIQNLFFMLQNNFVHIVTKKG